MSGLSCLLLRVTMTDALIILGVEDKAGKYQPLISLQTGSCGQGGWLHGPPLHVLPIPFSSSLGSSFQSTSKKLFITGENLPFAQKIEFHTAGFAV